MKYLPLFIFENREKSSYRNLLYNPFHFPAPENAQIFKEKEKNAEKTLEIQNVR